MTIRSIYILFTILITAIIGHAQTAVEMVKIGDKHLALGAYEEALVNYYRAYKENNLLRSEDSRHCTQLIGTCYSKLGFCAKAVEYLTLATEKYEPYNKEQKAELKSELKLNSSCKAGEVQGKQDPAELWNSIELGNIYLNTSSYGPALLKYNAALEKITTTPYLPYQLHAVFGKGYCLLQMNNPQEAVDYFFVCRAVDTLFAHSRGCNYWIAQAYYKQKNYYTALEWLEKPATATYGKKNATEYNNMVENCKEEIRKAEVKAKNLALGEEMKKKPLQVSIQQVKHKSFTDRIVSLSLAASDEKRVAICSEAEKKYILSYVYEDPAIQSNDITTQYQSRMMSTAHGLTMNNDSNLYVSGTDNPANAKQLFGPFDGLGYDGELSLSPDGRMAVWVSTRPGGYGGKDLWMATLTATGWSQAQNLGPSVNTDGDEAAPAVFFDGRTLYYTSDNLPGLGARDIYLSKLGPDGRWGIPQNIGYPINTEQDEAGFVMAADGTTGWLLRADENTVHKVMFPQAVHSQIRVWEYVITNELRDPPVYYQRHLTNLNTGITVSDTMKVYEPDAVALMPGTYSLVYYRKGYMPVDTIIPHTPNWTGGITRTGLQLIPMDSGATFVSHTILFNQDNTVAANSESTLKVLVDMMAKTNAYYLLISVHCEPAGDAKQNLEKTKAQATNLKEKLLYMGILPAKLKTEGLGDTQPLYDNNTLEGRQANNRVQITLIPIITE